MRATLRPRPPPPNAALMATGSPCSFANATTSSEPATGSGVPATSGRTGAVRDVARGDLVAERTDRGGRGTDPGQPGVHDGLGELGVLGEEAVAGVDGVGAGARRDVEQLVDDEVGLAGRRAAEGVRLVGDLHVLGVAVRVGVDRDRADAGVLAGAGDPDGDLAAVGDEDLRERPGGVRARRRLPRSSWSVRVRRPAPSSAVAEPSGAPGAPTPGRGRRGAAHGAACSRSARRSSRQRRSSLVQLAQHGVDVGPPRPQLPSRRPSHLVEQVLQLARPRPARRRTCRRWCGSSPGRTRSACRAAPAPAGPGRAGGTPGSCRAARATPAPAARSSAPCGG